MPKSASIIEGHEHSSNKRPTAGQKAENSAAVRRPPGAHLDFLLFQNRSIACSPEPNNYCTKHTVGGLVLITPVVNLAGCLVPTADAATKNLCHCSPLCNSFTQRLRTSPRGIAFPHTNLACPCCQSFSERITLLHLSFTVLSTAATCKRERCASPLRGLLGCSGPAFPVQLRSGIRRRSSSRAGNALWIV